MRSISVDRKITVGSWFEFRDLANEEPDSEIKSVVSGYSEKTEKGYLIIAHRVTVKNNTIVRSDWFKNEVESELDRQRFAIGSVSMNSVTIFGMRFNHIVTQQDDAPVELIQSGDP